MSRKRKAVWSLSPKETGRVQCFPLVPVRAFSHVHERTVHRLAAAVYLHRLDVRHEAIPGSVYEEYLHDPIRNVGLLHSREPNRSSVEDATTSSSTIAIDLKM